MTQEKAQKKARMGFRDRVRAAYKAFKSNEITHTTFTAQVGEALGEEKLPVIGAGKMKFEEVMKAFNLEEAPKPHWRSWMAPPPRINFTHCFSESNIFLT